MTQIKIPKKELSQDFKDEFVKNLQGKDFILYGGLLTLAKANKVKSINVEVLQYPSESNGNTAVCKAYVVDSEGNQWSEIGDAHDENCNKKVAAARIRMAATRAKGRALRDMLGIDMVMDSELSDPYEKEMLTQEQAKIIKRLMEKYSINPEQVASKSFELFAVKKATLLLKEQADTLIAELELEYSSQQEKV